VQGSLGGRFENRLSELPVHEALAVRALDRAECAVNVAVTEHQEVIVPEIRLRKVAVQVLLGATLIGPCTLRWSGGYLHQPT
jgi:hypothetical protein